MEKDKISLIIPVYNVEKFLSRCVNSVIKQTYKNLEIFLVDDGSTDNSGNLCDKYAQKDKRIKVIHKKNGGLSDARNVAIDKITGSYITFIDSDDYVSKDYVEYLFNNLKNTNSDISTCLYQSFYEGEEATIKEEVGELIVCEKEEALKRLFYQTQTTTSAWGKLYKKKLFKGIRYPKGKICEDLDTTYKLFSKSNKVAIGTAKNYYYLIRKDSIINSNFSSKRMDALKFAKNMVVFISTYYPSLSLSARNRYFAEAIFIFMAIPYKKDYYLERKKVFAVIKENRKEIIFDKNSRLFFRLCALASFCGQLCLKIMLTIKMMVK